MRPHQWIKHQKSLPCGIYCLSLPCASNWVEFQCCSLIGSLGSSFTAAGNRVIRGIRVCQLRWVSTGLTLASGRRTHVVRHHLRPILHTMSLPAHLSAFAQAAPCPPQPDWSCEHMCQVHPRPHSSWWCLRLQILSLPSANHDWSLGGILCFFVCSLMTLLSLFLYPANPGPGRPPSKDQ